MLQRVNRLAREAKTPGDGRSIDQVRADVFADLVTGRGRTPLPPGRWTSMSTWPPSPGSPRYPGRSRGGDRSSPTSPARSPWPTMRGEWRVAVHRSRNRRGPLERDHPEDDPPPPNAATCWHGNRCASSPGAACPPETATSTTPSSTPRADRTHPHNLGPLCRYHHRLRHEAGWKLEQPTPGPSSGPVHSATPTTHRIVRPEFAGRVGPGRALIDRCLAVWLPSAVRRPTEHNPPDEHRRASARTRSTGTAASRPRRSVWSNGCVARVTPLGWSPPAAPAPSGRDWWGRQSQSPRIAPTVPVALGPGVPGRVRRAIDGADLVHVHEPLMPLVSWSALAATVPIVGTFHADPSDLIRRSYRVAGPVLGIRRRLAAVTAVSQVAAAAVEPLFDEITVIPNAVEEGTIPDVDKVATRVAFVGRDDARKGLDVLLEAWPGVVAAVPGAELVVIGADRADRPGVRFLGRIPDADKMGALASATVFCAPNLGGESFGITLVEAMAAGCRVVASDLPGFREVLAGLGDLVPAGDPEALAGALVRALAGPFDPEPWRHRAAEFDWSVVLPRYLEVYRSVLRQGRLNQDGPTASWAGAGATARAPNGSTPRERRRPTGCPPQSAPNESPLRGSGSGGERPDGGRGLRGRSRRRGAGPLRCASPVTQGRREGSSSRRRTPPAPRDPSGPDRKAGLPPRCDPPCPAGPSSRNVPVRPAPPRSRRRSATRRTRTRGGDC